MKTCQRCDEQLKGKSKYCDDCRELSERGKAKAKEQKERRKVSRD